MNWLLKELVFLVIKIDLLLKFVILRFLLFFNFYSVFKNVMFEFCVKIF